MKTKKLVFWILLTTALIFSGCSNKGASSTANNTNKNSTSNPQVSTTASTPTLTTANTEATNPATTATPTTVKSNFEPIKPNTVPQLSTQQKKQIDSKLNSALKNLDNALKSIQDPSDIDLDSVN